jgi:hypothetical protein
MPGEAVINGFLSPAGQSADASSANSPATISQHNVAASGSGPSKKAIARAKKNGWLPTDHLVMHPNIIDGKWHCTSELFCASLRVIDVAK